MGLIVIEPGQATTVQDAGRPGYRRWGVPRGGAFDTASADLANALAGNPPGCAVLELTLIGGVYASDRPLALALAGAPLPAALIEPNSTVRTLDPPTSFTLQPGVRMRLGRTTRGARTYLAVRGGWLTPLVLGSRSSEDPLKAGARLAAEPGAIPIHRPRAAFDTLPSDRPFRILPGPEGALDSPILADLTRIGRRVGPHANRMGLRLEGTPIVFAGDPSRLSSPVSPGAIQLAGDHLIILGVACGTMGGYPHVAQIITADLDRLGQLAPGDEPAFDLVTLNEARELDRQARSHRRAELARIRTATEPGG